MPFENFDFTDFWDDCDYAVDKYIEERLTAEMLLEIENRLGYKLPKSYVWLMSQHNGGMPKNNCFYLTEDADCTEDCICIDGIMGIGAKKNYSICGEMGSRFMIDEWGYPDIGVAICDCPSSGHQMVFLDYRKCGKLGDKPSVVYIDQENNYKITPLADNFEDFICGLTEEKYDDTAPKSATDLGITSAYFSDDLLKKMRGIK